MKKIYFLQFLIIPYLAFSQTKIYLDDNISIIINKEFTKQKMSIDEVNKFIKNEKLEKILIKEKKNLENQLSYNITNTDNPKSFINININKINLPESISNDTMDKSEELKTFFTNYIDSEVSKNFQQNSEINAKLIDKTKMISVNGINILRCKISTRLKVKKNDFLEGEAEVLYIFDDTNMIILSIDKSAFDYQTWENLSQSIIQSIHKN